MRIALTGGIACGKSCVAAGLRAAGLRVIDADDVVHELIPAAERARLAAEVFANPAARAALEARIHPLVKERLAAEAERAAQEGAILVEIIPLLFEVHWNGIYDIICAVFSSKEKQIARMVESRGYSREHAEARLAAQIPAAEKAARADYVIQNDSTVEALETEIRKFADYVRRRTEGTGAEEARA